MPSFQPAQQPPKPTTPLKPTSTNSTISKKSAPASCTPARAETAKRPFHPVKSGVLLMRGRINRGLAYVLRTPFCKTVVRQMLIIPVLHPRNNNPRRPRPQHLPQRRTRPRIHPREMSLREPPEVPPSRGAGYGLAVEAGRYSLRGVPGEFQDDRHVWAEYCFWERTG